MFAYSRCVMRRVQGAVVLSEHNYYFLRFCWMTSTERHASLWTMGMEEGRMDVTALERKSF